MILRRALVCGMGGKLGCALSYSSVLYANLSVDTAKQAWWDFQKRMQVKKWVLEGRAIEADHDNI